MRRRYFKNFYFTFLPWLLAVIGISTVTFSDHHNVFYLIFIVSYWVLDLVGVYLLYQGYRLIADKMPKTDNYAGDLMLSASMISGFAIIVFLGYFTKILLFLGLVGAPIYALWNLYKYMTTSM